MTDKVTLDECIIYQGELIRTRGQASIYRPSNPFADDAILAHLRSIPGLEARAEAAERERDDNANHAVSAQRERDAVVADHIKALNDVNERRATAEAETARLRARVEGLEAALKGFDKMVSKGIVEKPGPHRVHVDGEWYTGPLADYHLTVMQAIQRISRAALNGGPDATT